MNRPLLASLILPCAVLLAACAARPPASDTPPIGVQLWSVKDEIKADFDGTIVKLGALGFEGVEFAGEFGRFGRDPAGLRSLLAKHGLRCAGAHVGLDQLSGARFAPTTAFYQALGCSDLIIPFDERGATLAGMPLLARDISALAVRLDSVGMRIGYHNHAPEMDGPDGHTPWDLLARGTPANVILQQDIGWTSFAGKDPVAYIARYPQRSVSLHYKAKLAPGTSGAPVIGRDSTDWLAVTRAARSVGGTSWLIVEQEEYPDGMGQVEAVAASLRGLRAALAVRVDHRSK
jgi:sugar phosphate isomerase/epimerase